jgi:hypothetical protein
MTPFSINNARLNGVYCIIIYIYLLIFAHFVLSKRKRKEKLSKRLLCDDEGRRESFCTFFPRRYREKKCKLNVRFPSFNPPHTWRSLTHPWPIYLISFFLFVSFIHTQLFTLHASWQLWVDNNGNHGRLGKRIKQQKKNHNNHVCVIVFVVFSTVWKYVIFRDEGKQRKIPITWGVRHIL